MRLPRLPTYATIQEAADWLSKASTEDWSASSVLSRLMEFDVIGKTETGEPHHLETIYVVAHPGDDFLALNTGIPFTLQHVMLLQTCAPLDSLIESLALTGCCQSPTLRLDNGDRLRHRGSVRLCDIRLKGEWVEPLLPPFDRLVYEINQGKHQWVLDLEIGSKAKTNTPAPSRVSGKDRDKEIYERCNSVRASGNHKFLQAVASEYKVSPSAIKQARTRHKKRICNTKESAPTSSSLRSQICAATKSAGYLEKAKNPHQLKG